MIPIGLRAIALTGALSLTASHRANPHISYDVSFEPGDPSSIRVAMRIENAPRSVRLAMAVHPEYDDRFWRYITDWHVDGMDRRALLAVDRDNVWRVLSHAGYTNVSYRIQLPRENPNSRPVWHTALRADGGSINTIDTFLYLPDFPHADIRIRLANGAPVVWDIPGGNSIAIAGGLAFQEFSTDAATLLDSPLPYGSNLRLWHFEVDHVRHAIVYWPLPNATPFDSPVR